MLNPSMKQLRYFESLARHRHFGRAAADCAISQPALSVQIRDLEALVGAPLVERGARQIRLTPLGERVAERVRDILHAVDDLGNLSRASRAPFLGHLRIGIIPTVAPYLLPALIKGLGAEYPGLEIRPREAITQKLIADLGEGRLDAVIVALPITEPTLVTRPLFEESFMLVRPLAAAETPVPPIEALRDMQLLLLEEGHCFRDQAIEFCQLSSTPSRDLIEGSSLSTLVQMVGAEIGVTLIPEIAVAMETRSAAVSIGRLASPSPSRTIGMVWRKSNPLSEEIADIAAMVEKLAERQRAALSP